MCVTLDGDLAERLRILRVHGGQPKYYHSIVGGNFRLDALQAAVLLVKLRHLDDWTAGRQANAATYNRLLEPAGQRIRRPVVRTGTRSIFNQYTIRVEDRDGMVDHLRSKGIGTEVYYPVPLHLQECFRYLGYQEGDCPESEAAAATVLSLPIYPELSADQQEFVAGHVLEYLD